MYLRMFAPFHSAIDGGEHENISSCHCMEMQKIHSCIACAPRIDSSCSVLSNNLENDLSKRTAC